MRILSRDFVFFDGAQGSMLQKRGLQPGMRADVMNMTAPHVVEEIQNGYALAGSDILCTNTFGANARELGRAGYSVEEVISAAAAITKRAGMGKTLTALDMGPIGEFLAPHGALSFHEAYELFREQAVAGEKAGVDLVAIETMSDLLEVKAAMLAVKENTNLPIFVTMTFMKSERTYLGCTPESFALMAGRLGAAAVGLNCSLAPREVAPVVRRMARVTRLPLIVKPNAGMPDKDGNYSLGPEAFAEQMAAFAGLGAKVVGGCCGTTPEYIGALRKTYEGLRPSYRAVEDTSRLIASPCAVADVSGFRAPAERALRGASAEEAAQNALRHAEEAGAEIVSVSLEGLAPEEAERAVLLVQQQSTRPVCILSGSDAALEAALRVVSGTAAVLRGCCPEETAARYGAVLIG
ncbi:MAG: homocysteine S-methyltransferase family protein [Clostridiales bacterium]|nr:homocysteine S-methyltransferase family protein [Clostridiales bacterium]